MTVFTRILILLFITCVQLTGLYNILIGLIGTKNINNKLTPIPTIVGLGPLGRNENEEFSTATNSQNVDHVQSHQYEESADQIAIFIIDAMRVDFLFNYELPFVTQLIDDSFGCVFVSNVKTPTVTLPRIKALVTGDISSYWDIIQNFYSTRLQQDNFILRAKEERNKTIIFYGDDTWIKLFPAEFDRAEGVSSFYVTDFFEVDNNVTRNVNLELDNQLRWDMMILHYLGLDHIGHVHGLKSPKLIQTKLHEMDDVIRKIYKSYKGGELPSYLIICGDHGMANIGGHGSNSYAEVTTPLIVLSTKQMNKKFCTTNGNWKKQGIRGLPTVEQIDLATTVSLLWGLHLPSSSLGKLIPGVIQRDNIQSLLFAKYYNVIHLKNILASANIDEEEAVEIEEKWKKVFASHVKCFSNQSLQDDKVKQLMQSYDTLLAELSSKATEETVGEQNILQIFVGASLLIQSCVLIISFDFIAQEPFNVLVKQIWLVRRTFIVPAVLVGLPVLLLTQYFHIFVLVLFYFGILKYISGNTLWNAHQEFVSSCLELNIVHLVSPFIIYFSSSFVEEEHLLRYYIWPTCILMQFMSYPAASKNGSLKISWSAVIQILILLLSHRISMCWNSTGQKWEHIPGLVDSIEAMKIRYSFPLIVFGIATPLLLYLRRGKSTSFPAALFLVTFFKYCTITGELSLFGGQIALRHELLERLSLAVILSEWIVSRFLNKCKAQVRLVNCWILFSIVLYRFSNIPLIPLELLQLQLVQRLFAEADLIEDKYNAVESGKALLYIWFGWTSFYYQGNSNNIASIDINAGYIGQSSYNQVVAGVLVFCNTFSAIILQLLHFLETTTAKSRKHKTDISDPESKTSKLRLEWSYFTLWVMATSYNSTIYAIAVTVFKEHLFIWSVFTPKLLYVVAYTLLNCVILFMALMVSFC